MIFRRKKRRSRKAKQSTALTPQQRRLAANAARKADRAFYNR